jgi:hypothetical protein
LLAMGAILGMFYSSLTVEVRCARSESWAHEVAGVNTDRSPLICWLIMGSIGRDSSGFLNKRLRDI